ncbi:PREDICTED: O-acyltransferase [Prunus dulcis]|uniref:PREDICTED: O-acyltransferase n=1 Tax=Prunus dulcis TaxID=3755 RepID=A0A5E4FJG4_PRUDU|nr:PREDICTED: O-acyltransferase [Prunus dulcis]
METEEGIRLRKPTPIKTKREEEEEGRRDGGEAGVDIRNCNKEMMNVEEEPLSPAARLFHEPNFNLHIVAIMGCKTRIYPEVFKANLPHTLLRHPRFSSLLVVDEKNEGKMKWVRTEVDLDKHIIIPDLDPNMESPDQFVEDYIYNLSKTTIDKSKPLWDLHLLNLKTSEAEGTGIFRVHHSLGDGTSLMSLLLACTRQISNPEALPTIPVKKKKNDDKRVFNRGFWWVLKFFWNTFADVFMFMLTALCLEDTKTPLKGPPGSEFNPRRFVYQTLSLDDMKLIKNAMNLALADMMEKNTEAKWGNWIGYVLLPFTIALRDDPLDYIREAKTTIDRKKHSLEAIYTFSIAELVLKLFGIKRASALSHRIISHTTMCFSNLVGPLEEIGFYGHPMAFLAPSSYGQPHALVINFQSYINKMTIVLSVDEETIPDPHLLCDDIVQSLNLIKEAVVARGLVK